MIVPVGFSREQRDGWVGYAIELGQEVGAPSEVLYEGIPGCGGAELFS